MLDAFASMKSTVAGGGTAALPGNGRVMQAGSPRRRFLLRPALTLMVLDLFFMSASIAGFTFAIKERLGFIGIPDTLSAVICMVVASGVLAYGTGAYQQDSFLDFSTTTTRLAVGLGVGV